MGTIKTTVNNTSVKEFIKNVEDERKRKDSLILLTLFKKVTHENPKMWGASIIGYGSYHYKSTRSSQEGDWPLIGFSPRKQNLTLYIMSGFKDTAAILKKLGKNKTSVGCLYINKLEDIDLTILETLIQKSFMEMKKKHT